ncbi:MAG: hypothetical protein V5A33_07130 [Halobacteriales archaeon]
MVAKAVGLSDGGAAIAFLLALAVLLKPFVRVFRGFMPDRIDADQ